MPATVNAPVGTVNQTLRLTRTELTLFYRYRMALYIAVLPLMFVAIGLVREGNDALPGVDAAALYIAGTIPLSAMIVGIMHIANVLTARREQMVLKRFLVSGVPPAALFGAAVAAVAVVVALLGIVIGVLLAWRYQLWPSAPALLVLSLVLITVIMTLLGAAVTRLARNAEIAQMVSVVPFLLFYVASGLAVPFDMMPDNLATLCRALPMAPAVELIQSAYTGRDLVGASEGVSSASMVELWTAGWKPLLTLLVWTVLSLLSLRFFRWDPRQSA